MCIIACNGSPDVHNYNCVPQVWCLIEISESDFVHVKVRYGAVACETSLNGPATGLSCYYET